MSVIFHADAGGSRIPLRATPIPRGMSFGIIRQGDPVPSPPPRMHGIAQDYEGITAYGSGSIGIRLQSDDGDVEWWADLTDRLEGKFLLELGVAESD